MGDIAQILGIATKNAKTATGQSTDDIDDYYPSLRNNSSTHQLPRAVKLQQLPKDVLDLIGGSSISISRNSNDHTNKNNSNSDNPVYVDLPPAVPAVHIRKTTTSKVDNNTAIANATNTATTTTNNKADIVVKVGNKWISSINKARSWIWSPFTSSARNDGLVLYHWVRNHVEYIDYPYARFNIHLDPLIEQSYDTDKIYNAFFLQEQQSQQHNINKQWSRSETDQLMELVQRYELRWPVIYDRWTEIYNYNDNTASRNSGADSKFKDHVSGDYCRYRIEDLQHRFYTIAAFINQCRIRKEAEIEAHSLSIQTNTAIATAATTTTTTSAINGTTTTTPTDTSSKINASATNTVTNAAVTDTTAASAAAASTATVGTEQDSTTNKQRAVESLLIETAAARSLATTELQYQPLINNIASGTSNKVLFDLQKERERREHMDALWKRSKDEEMEELELRKELKQIEAQLRKLKKSGVHIAAATGTTTTTTTTALSAANSTNPSTAANGMAINAPSTAGGSMSQTPSRTNTPIQFNISSGDDPMSSLGPIAGTTAVAIDPSTLPATLDQVFTTNTSSGPIAVPGIPYLQSCRLLPPGVGDGATISPALLSRMDMVLDELHIPKNPIPTKRVCDLYDNLRKDILTLLILQKEVLQKEGLLATKHLKLAKKRGNPHVNDEEALLGIPPPMPVRPSPSTSTNAIATASATASGKGSRSTKSKATTAADGTTTTGKKKASTNKATGISKDDAGLTATSKSNAGAGATTVTGSGGKQPRKPSANKRKRKSDDSGAKGTTSVSEAVAATGQLLAIASTTATTAGSTTSLVSSGDNVMTHIPITSSMDSSLNIGTDGITNSISFAAVTTTITGTATMIPSIQAGPTTDTTTKPKKRPKKTNTEAKS